MSLERPTDLESVPNLCKLQINKQIFELNNIESALGVTVDNYLNYFGNLTTSPRYLIHSPHFLILIFS